MLCLLTFIATNPKGQIQSVTREVFISAREVAVERKVNREIGSRG